MERLMDNILSNSKVLLVPLMIKEADAFYRLYTNRKVIEHYEDEVIHSEENPEAFTQRIISVCTNIWTVRSFEKPALIMGDCALHHYNPEKKAIEIGGSLTPDCWGKDYMSSAFSLAIGFAREKYAVKMIVAKTTSANKKAIRFAEKFGFSLSDEGIFCLKL